MKNKELEIDSHKMLLKLVEQIANPMYIIPASDKDKFNASAMGPGTVFVEGMVDLKEFKPISQETKELVIRTFCESHLSLQKFHE